MNLVIASFLVLFALAYWLNRKTFSYWKELGVVQFPVTFPYGNLKGVFKDQAFSEFIAEFYQKTKKVGASFCGLYLYTQPVLMITDLDLLKTIFVKDFNVFSKRGHYYNEKDDPLSAHMINLDYEPWRQLRQKLSPTFTSNKLKMVFEIVAGVVDRLLEVINKEVSETAQLEVKTNMGRFTTDLIGATAFGIDCNSLENKDSQFYEMGNKVVSSPSSRYRRILRSAFKSLTKKFRLLSHPKDVTDFYMRITRGTVEYREKNPQENRQDFMSLLVQLKQVGALSIEQISAQCFIFFIAGYETSSNTLSFCLYELAINEEIQEKARLSVQDVYAKHKNRLTFESLNELHYLEQCVNETLRKYSIVSTIHRMAVRDYEIPNSQVAIKKGQLVWIPVHAIHHDGDIYPKPNVYDPDRFLPEEIAKRHPFAFLPFGEGPRVCIAKK